MSKKISKSKKQYNKSYETPSQDTDFATTTGTQGSERQVIEGRTIVININSLKNIVPLYPISDIKVQLKYLDIVLGESRPIPVGDNELLLNISFELLIDIESPKQLDLLASNPVFITVLQLTGTQDPSMYEYLQISAEATKAATADIDSLFRLYEAYNGERPPMQLSELKKKKKGKKERIENGDRPERLKSRSKSVTSRDSKSSKKSKNKLRSESKSKSELSEVKRKTYGMCAIDLIPLFYGETSFSETLLIQPVEQSCQILSTYKNFPEISITVAIKDNAKFIDIPNILNFTVESICNVPSSMLAEMDCKVCAMLPLFNLNASPTIFQNPKITTSEPDSRLNLKRWPGLHDIGHNANTTKYFIDDNFEEISNKANLNIREAFREGARRVEYNYLKRNILYEYGNSDFAAHVQSHRKIAVEIYLIQKTKKQSSLNGQSENFDESAHRRSGKSIIKSPPHLHLMAVLDLVDLLYPGVTKLHIAAPITNFTFEEAAKAGLHDSYFLPKPIGYMATTRGSKTKLEGTEKNKRSAERKDKNANIDKQNKSVIKDDKNLASQLPPKPEEPRPPEPCKQVYNDNGDACFIIIELELLNPINKKLNIGEIVTDFYNLQLETSQSSKTILNQAVADEHYNRTIKEISNDIDKHWQDYNKNICSIPMPGHKIQFANYLKKLGAYQLYTNSIITSATLLITHNYKCFECDFRNNKDYQDLISEAYTGLIDKMYSILGASNDMKVTEEKYSIPWNTSSYFYAKEAAELKLQELAERYFLERIIVNNDHKETLHSWFDFAIYNIEINNSEKAFECVKEAIALNSNSKYDLLLFAILLADKDMIQDAEICFLNILDLESEWLEGWCVLYLFYQKCSRLDGMEMALDIVKKFVNGCNSDSDYFETFEDLAWSWQNIPKTFYFNTAVLLLKMRLYSWAELALAEELLVPKHYGYVNYLLAVGSYYKKNFEHALEHIKEAKESLGANCTILALSGHILLAQSKENEAKNEYFRIIESFNKPKDIHLVYLNCAEILAKQGEGQTARKFILNTCKIHQTPHVWFTAGKLYYEQNDLVSAEECFNKVTMKDNRYAEAWGYLTLLNLKLGQLQEAEQYYEQAVKNKLSGDGSLNQIIVEKLNKARSL